MANSKIYTQKYNIWIYSVQNIKNITCKNTKTVLIKQDFF